jgi:hypothetical protein
MTFSQNVRQASRPVVAGCKPACFEGLCRKETPASVSAPKVGRTPRSAPRSAAGPPAGLFDLPTHLPVSPKSQFSLPTGAHHDL